MEIIRKYSFGSKFIFAAVVLGDIVLANIVYIILVHLNLPRTPVYLEWHDAEGLTYVTLISICSQMFFSSVIHRRRISVVDVFLRVARMAVVHSVMLLVVIRVLVGDTQGALRFALYYFCSFNVVMLFVRFAERSLLNYIRRLGMNSRSVVFIGSDPANLNMYKEINRSASVGYRVEGYYSNDVMKNAPEEFKRIGDRDSLVDAILHGEEPFSADVVFTSLSTLNDDRDINAIINYCDKHIIQFYLVPRINANLNMNLSPLTVGDFTVFTNHTNNINRWDNRVVKRIFDIIMSTVVCILILPLIPIIWLIIKIQSPGPLIFAQERTGLNGETFVCYKFRSMHVNADADKKQATKHDPRKFPFGEFMRRTNIDELPQFFNVLRGDMSVVGPRPHMLYHTEMYSNIISKYMVRHFSKPGITGWAQVTGYRGETQEVWQMEERIKRDIWYNENWSLMLDLEIICRTVLQIVNPDKNAY